MTAPCKDCARREIGCHASCEEYLCYFNGRKEYNQARHNAVCANGFTDSYAKILKKRKKRFRG